MSIPLLDLNTKNKILGDILVSDDFSKSPKYHDLLQYLFEASLDDEMIKATTLAIEFFGKDATFDQSMDSSVRSYVSNLRKKIDHYYLTAGRGDKYRILIPIGHYNVRFEENISYSVVNNPIQNKTTTVAKSPIWTSFLESEKKTLLVFGDYFFYGEPLDEERRRFIRDIQINSEQELDTYLIAHPEMRSKVRKTTNTFLDPHVPYVMSKLVPLLVLQKRPFDIKLASDVQSTDLQNCNIIYIGSHKNLRLLERFTSILDFEYSILPTGVKFVSKESDSTIFYSADDIDSDSPARLDFPVIIKQRGPNNSSFLFFLALYDMGIIGSIKYFTDPNYLEEFIDKVDSSNFVALFKTLGYRREDFSTELLHLNMLPDRLILPTE